MMAAETTSVCTGFFRGSPNAMKKGAMILTSILTFGSWDQAFAGDPVLTAAIVVRKGTPSPIDHNKSIDQRAVRAMPSRTNVCPIAQMRGTVP